MDDNKDLRSEFIEAVEHFKRNYNGGAYSFEVAQMRLFAMVKQYQSIFTDTDRKRIEYFIETIRRKGQIIEF